MRKTAPGAYLALISAVVIWGLSFVATKMALESIPTFTLIFARFGIGACLFIGIMAKRGVPRLSKGDNLRMFLTALFEPGLYFFFETVGLQYTTAAKASLIIAAIPVVVLILGRILIKEKTGFSSFIGVAVSIAGISILVAGDPRIANGLGGGLLGDMLIFGAVLSASLYTISVRHLAKRHSSFEITTMQTIYGGIFYAPAFLWELPGIEFSAISGRSIGALVYLTLFATIIAFLCYNHALSKLTAAKAAVFINGVPVVTAIGAWIILGERLTLIQAMGGLLVLFGVFLTNFQGVLGKNRRATSN